MAKWLYCMLLLSEVKLVYPKVKLHLATLESWSYAPFGLPVAGAGIDMAVEYIKEKYNDTIEFSHSLRQSVSGPTEAGAKAAELYLIDKADVFIGPGSSSSVEAIAYMMTEWNVPIIAPSGGSGILSDNSLFPVLTRVAPLNVGSYGAFYVRLLETFSWRHVVVLHDMHGHSASQWKTVKAAFDRTVKYAWTHYKMDYETFEDENFEYVLTEANKYARVFIVLCNRESVRQIMLIAHRLGYTKGEHVFIITTSYITTVPETYWKQEDGMDEVAKEAYKSSLFLTTRKVSTDSFSAFAEEVKLRALRDYNFDFRTWSVPEHVAAYYDAFTMYAQVANETIADGEDPLNGTAIAQRLWNREYTGIAGRFFINKDGIRDSDLTLQSIDPTTGIFRVVGLYRGDTDVFTADSENTIYWPNDKGPPDDVPLCGFRNDKCATNANNDSLVYGLVGAFAVLVVITIIIVSILVRRWKLKSESDLWWWKIDPKDLQTDTLKSGSYMQLSSKLSLISGKTDTPFLDYMTDTAVYKGLLVRLKKLSSKNILMNRALLLEFKQVRELNQGNLTKVFGASLDASPRCLVTEFCSKGTLQDLLGNTRLSLDTHFKFSLCIDVVKGLCFLHDSPIQKHGRLTSESCLIDNRFSVKLTDFGLDTVYNTIHNDMDSQEYQNECLWKAPEFLRGRHIGGTKSGDVYSFGIILQELFTRETPYYEELATMDIKSILGKVEKGLVPPFRPQVSVPEKLIGIKTLIENCWMEEPNLRPDAHSVKKSLTSLASRFGASGNLLDNLLSRMEQYANNLEKLVDEKTTELKDEKKKSEELLYQILPKSVAVKLRLGQRIDAESFGCVTIYFSDICGFTTISAHSTPFQVVDLLNDLYTCFDAIIDHFDVYKVETIGDAYMVVSGLPQRNGNRHALEIARMSLALLKAIDTFTIRHLPDEKLMLRIGLHSGPVVAGVVGLKMPRYCLFGDTVNTASRMESHGEALKIHLSKDTRDLLTSFDMFDIYLRGNTEIKGKGHMDTYWLKKESDSI